MNKKEFIELTGEDPVDVLGQDWKNEVDEYEDVEEKYIPRLNKIVKSSEDQNE